MAKKRIALTGGIATGKSTVAKYFGDLGVTVIDADKAARQAVRPGSACWQDLFDLLGEAYFEKDGRLKRRQLREKIVQEKELRKRVNDILHPFIISWMETEWEKIKKKPSLFDIPLLFESGMAHRFDTIILVYAPPDVQIERLMKRDKITYEEAAAALQMQLPIDSKIQGSHIIIDNTLDLKKTLKQVKRVWRKLFADR